MQHQQLLPLLVDKLQNVGGVQAIVLGGSFASETARPDSDIDIGLYYEESKPLDIVAIRAIANELHDYAEPVVTELGGWGPWVNGGAWLTIQGQRVDLLYRNSDFVAKIIDDCNRGIIVSDYWQQPAYGFHSFMYCSETSICKPLFDPDGLITRLKGLVSSYSPQLKQAIIKNFLWSAQFSLMNAEKPVKQVNVYMTVGCLARAIHCLVQVLYALNESYYLSEKRLAHDVQLFQIALPDFYERISTILGTVGTTQSELQSAFLDVKMLYEEVADLTHTHGF